MDGLIQMEIGFIGVAIFDDCDGQGSVINPDYDMSDCILPLDNNEMAVEKVSIMLNKSNNEKIRLHLSKKVEEVKNQSKKMWKTVWSL